MNKFKIFLVSLALISCSSFAFAMGPASEEEIYEAIEIESKIERKKLDEEMRKVDAEIKKKEEERRKINEEMLKEDEERRKIWEETSGADEERRKK